MNLPQKLTIKDFATFAKNHPTIAQAIEEKFGSMEGTLVLTREQLAQLPEHMVREMVEPKAAAAQREEAIARLEQYWERERGLRNSQHNADALAEGLRMLGQGFTAASVDRTILVLREQGKLQWKSDKPATPPAPAPQAAPAPAAVAPAATPEPVAPPPAKLKDGTDPLPLDADEWAMRKATKAQLQELSARRGEGRQRVPWRFRK